MKLARFLFALMLLSLFAPISARAAATEATLILSADAARPGDTVMAGIRMTIQPKWHIYWRNPGIGIPPSIAWHLPPGITAGEIQWPTPKKLPAEDLTTYIYENEVVLLVPLKIATDAKPGAMQLKARVDWQECMDICVTQHQDVQVDLTIGNDQTASPEAPLIEAWQKKLPLIQPGLAAHAMWEGPANGDTRGVLFDWPASNKIKDADFYPDSNDKYEVQWNIQFAQADDNTVRVRKLVKKSDAAWPSKINGLFVQKNADGAVIAYDVNLPVTEANAGQTASPVSTLPNPLSNAPTPVASHRSLLSMLFYAFLGGMILNVMPCVLPVIALKILGFVNQTREHPRQVRKLGLVYTLGVLASFLALAGIVILVKSFGHAASWGMQFQNPQFLVVMTALVTLVALNLFGVFEVNLGGNVMGAAGNLASREGYEGAFLNGVLATILATPCTAPFLGVALGFAFTQPAHIIVLIFLMVGVGLAAPYLILSWEPAWLKFLPKPGVWMEKFKMAMGFPMLATAIWLFTLATGYFGEDSDLWLGLFLVLLGLVAWVWGEFVQRGRARRGLSGAISLVIFLGGYFFLLEKQLNWRHRVMAEKNGSLQSSPDGIDWKTWSPDALKEARMSGKPVLVDFTAKWCLICQLNKRDALEIPSVRTKLRELGAIALEENSYTKDAAVVAELNRYERAGVPLVLVYPKNPNAPPEVLPELLTPGIVLQALDKAAND